MHVQLTFDDFRRDDNLLCVPPERIFELIDAKMLQELAEDSRFERKAPNVQSKDLAEYFSMWANTPDGGLIVVGQADKSRRLLGLTESGQSYINTIEQTARDHCPDASFEHKRVSFLDEDGNTDFVLVFYVHYNEKKVVSTRKGDCFHRLGDSKVKLAPDQVRQLRVDKGEVSQEQEYADAEYPKDFDLEAIQSFADSVISKSGYDANHSKEDILELKHLGKITPDRFLPNVACLLLFGKDPSKSIPGAYIRFFRFDGTAEGTGEKWNAVKDEWIRGTIPEQIRQCENILKSQLRTFSRLGKGGKFFTAPEYPEMAWYEAIVNACAHRSYGDSLKNCPIQVKMFDDRLEIESPGPFMPYITPENIYTIHMPRNPKLMGAMYFLDFVKCAHEGTRRMKESMTKIDLPAPEFTQRISNGAIVKVVLRNKINQRKAWLDGDVATLIGQAIAHELQDNEKRCINFIAENGEISVTEALRLTGMTWPAASKMLASLAKRNILFKKRTNNKDRDPGARYILKPPSQKPNAQS